MRNPAPYHTSAVLALCLAVKREIPCDAAIQRIGGLKMPRRDAGSTRIASPTTRGGVSA